MRFQYKLGFIGSGNMARAIINGVIASKIVSPSDIIASHNNACHEVGIEGIRTTLCNADVVKNSEIVFLAVKPQVFNIIGEELLKECKAKYIISMMAGVSSDSIRALVADDTIVLRIMPNTPCKIGKGVTAIETSNIDSVDKAYIFNILSSMGDVVEVDEDLFDAVVAVSGSGPAYAFMFLRALINGGVEKGLDYANAKRLAIGMLSGASALASASDDLDALIDAVCSKGGTTIEAVKYYEQHDLEGIVRGGMDKCYMRSRELSKK